MPPLARWPGLVALAFAACGAPAAEMATGAVAADVERSLASGSATFDHGTWDTLLREGTRDGFVDYAYMAEQRGSLDAYADRIATVDLGALESDELEALLINAYNALTVIAILDHPTVASIREIDGVWTSLTWNVGGHPVTLDNLEHNLLRPFYRDPRIHFAVNCASYSCAPLPPWAFTGRDLDAQLESRTRDFLADPKNVSVGDGELRLSRYFDWYGEDFTAEGWSPRAETIAAFIAPYATPEVRAAIEADPQIPISFVDYDWSLNAIERPPAAAKPNDRVGGLAGFVARLRDRVAGFGMAAPLVYGLVYIVAVVLLIPGSALTLGAGVGFGIALGTVTVLLSATIGACLAFLIARYLLRSRVERWLAGRQRLSAVDRAVERQGWRVVALTRLSPAFPFNVQNYFYGLTGVGFWQYAITSLFTMLPGTLLYVYIGVAGAEVAEATGGAAGWGRTVLLVAGLAATFLLVVMITRVAQRELEKATSAAVTGDPVPAPPEPAAPGS